MMNMNGNYFQFNKSVKGFSHRIRNIICQDASKISSDGKILVIAVADGHGSEPLSQFGSEFAVDIACNAIIQFVKDLQEAHKIDSFKSLPNYLYCGINAKVKNNNFENLKPLFLDKNGLRKIINNSNSLEEEIDESLIVEESFKLLSHLEKNILYEWFKKVSEDFDSKKDTNEFEFDLKDNEKFYHLYGTTLLATCITEDFWFAIQIGDGTCVALYDSIEESNVFSIINQPIPIDERCYRNITTSMCDSDSYLEFRHCIGTKLPKAIFIGSDGIENSFSKDNNDQELQKFYLDLINDFSRISNEKERTDYLGDKLKKLTEDGSGDDVSVAGLIDKSWLVYKMEENKIIDDKIEESSKLQKECEETCAVSSIPDNNIQNKSIELALIKVIDNNIEQREVIASSPKDDSAIGASERDDPTPKINNTEQDEVLTQKSSLQTSESDETTSITNNEEQKVIVSTPTDISSLRTSEEFLAIDNEQKSLAPIKENIYEAIKAKFDSKIIIKLAKRDSALLNKKYDSDGNTPLILAIINKYSIEVIEELLKNGSDVNLANDSGNTPLILAVQYYVNDNNISVYDIVKLLLEKGADPNKKNNSLNSALFYAVMDNFYNKSTVEALINYGADINSQNNGGVSILYNFVFNGPEYALQSFLNQDGLNINIQDISNRTVLSHVLEKRNDINNRDKDWEKIFNELINHHNAKLSDSIYDNKLLFDAIKKTTGPIMIKIYIKLGINVNAVDSETGLTALQFAKNLGKEEIAKVLMEAGAK